MGVKRIKGKGVLYEEPKKNVRVGLTQTAVDALDAEAAKQGISRSELIERIARSLPLSCDVALSG